MASEKDEVGAPPRRLVVWCPDWPVTAAAAALGLAPLAPAAVLVADRVLACSGPARSAGVRRGQRRREAQGHCPELVVCEYDPARDARLFEPVAAALESLAPGVELLRPGLAAVPARGPAGYFGSEEEVAERVVDRIGEAAGAECQVGVADGLLAAVLAARRGVLVPPGRSPGFLAPLPVDEIGRAGEWDGNDRSALVDLLRRLGIRTLGEFAALPARDVATRFGARALAAHRAAGGLEERPPVRRRPPPELTVTEHLDPPVERVHTAAFVAGAPAERLHSHLAGLGLACTVLEISARTGNGERLRRVWRCAEPLTPSGTADRVRWQLDGWLAGRGGEDTPTAGVVELSLRPAEVVGAGGLQLDLVGSAAGEADDRAARAFARVQGMLGPDAVVTGVPGGGRNPGDRVRLVTWGDRRRPALDPAPPWPGRLPAPSPTVLPDPPWPAEVLDAAARPVRVTERQRLGSPPARVVVPGAAPREVVAWSGPWPLEERWWVGGASVSRGIATPRPSVRLQVVLAPTGDAAAAPGEAALLLVHEAGRWWVRGVYR